ncbi:MAG: hypothetical protein GY791_01865 [Alphaproteobacteria bacterium]|nr:hypothetical protein [Alphaproteobacteria bacterium]
MPRHTKTDLGKATAHASLTLRRNPSGGCRLRYFDDGHLWHPGYKVILRGEWKVQPGSVLTKSREKTAKGVEVREFKMPENCYRYSSDGNKPVSKQQFGRWECEQSLMLLLNKRVVERRKDDVFGLGKRRAPPFVLKRDKTTIDNLLAQCRDC